MPTNRRVLLAARPQGLPTEETFQVEEQEVADPGDGEFVVKLSHISLDPAMRGWMNDVESYMPPVGLGDVMRAGGIGEVTASNHDTWSVGDTAYGTFGVQQYATSDGRGVQKVDPSAAPIPTYLSALGMTGMTAYFGLLDLGDPKEGETVVVSGAAGAVGSAVGQIAKIKGCRTIGIAGGPEKCAHVVDDLHFDACIDYQNENVRKRLKELAPDRVDIYFDNVGNPILDQVLARINMHARVIICGAIAQYNADRPEGPANYMQLLVRRARMEGFLVFDYASRFGEAIQEIAGWMREGKFVSREDIVTAPVDAFPTVLRRLFDGDNVGKLVLEVEHA
jgi:NADPH-dependent curcumin reductase CurA